MILQEGSKSLKVKADDSTKKELWEKKSYFQKVRTFSHKKIHLSLKPSWKWVELSQCESEESNQFCSLLHE